jgi:hypothetical protein
MNQPEARAGRVLNSAVVFVETLEKIGITKGETLFVNDDVPVGTVKLIIGTKP